MRTCCVCGDQFVPTGKVYRCLSCRRDYERQWRAARKAAGNPVKPIKLPAEYHRTVYKNAHNIVRKELMAGRIARQPCEVCGNKRVHAHHDDYNRPLDVRWLCPKHHSDHHRAAEGR